MQLKDIYEREITRKIDPVAVVSNLEAKLVQQEIDEYVFTPDIINYLGKFFKAFFSSKGGKTGVWINGYYGSGKSHFLKYIFYCLDPKYREKALEHYQRCLRETEGLLEVSEADIKAFTKSIGKFPIETIMFNIDSVAGRVDDKEAITKILLNRLNAYRGYNDTYMALADLEKLIDEAGKFDEFKKAVKKKFKEDWEKKGPDLAENFLDDVLSIAKELVDIDVKSTRAHIERAIAGKDELSVKHLVDRLQDFLKDKPKDYRLIFLMDEVSQYIGANLNLLLNLQTIVEEVGAKCDNQVWVVCTAQQEIKEVIENVGKNPTDFGKVMARFETKIPLQSQDASEITKKRVLEKNSNGLEGLTKFYSKNHNIIENQFVAPHNLYKSFRDKDDFLSSYPFVPYQFQLISDVFKSFSDYKFVTEGVRNTERSILGITHFTAKECREKEIGFVVPFDAFFNSQFRENLTQLASNILQRAYKLDEVSKDPFAIRVANALFMLSNLKDQYKANLSATVDNISFLLMDSVDQDTAALKRNVRKVLEILEARRVIIESEGIYRFLGEDEIIVINDIKNTRITLDSFLTEFYEKVIEPQTDVQKRVSFEGNNYDVSIKVDGKDFARKGDFNIIFSVTDPNEEQQLMLQSAPNDLTVCLNALMDKDLREGFNEYVQVNTYIRNNSDSADSKRRETLQNFRQQADIKLSDLKKRLEQKLMQAKFISQQNIIDPNSVSGTSAKAKFNNILQSHLQQVYRKKKLADGYAQNADMLKNTAVSTQLSTDKTLSAAENAVDQVIDTSGGKMIVAEVVRIFEQPPYGWRDIATLDVLLHLARKNKRKFTQHNEPIDAKTFAAKVINSRERTTMEVLREEETDSSVLDKVVKLVNSEIFNETVLDGSVKDANIIFTDLKTFLAKKSEEIQKYRDQYTGSNPFGIHFKNFHESVKSLADRRDKNQLFKEIMDQADALKGLCDNYKEVREFVDELIDKYNEIKSFTEDQAGNFSRPDLAQHDRGEMLQEYFKKDDKPGNKFPQVKKAYEELGKALKEKIKELREQAVKTYNGIFDRLEAKAREFDLALSTLPSRDGKIDNLKKGKSISELKYELSNAGSYEHEYLEVLFKAKKEKDESEGKKSKSAEFVSVVNDDGGGKTIQIENEEQLDKFIKDFRERLAKKLKENKIIILK